MDEKYIKTIALDTSIVNLIGRFPNQERINKEIDVAVRELTSRDIGGEFCYRPYPNAYPYNLKLSLSGNSLVFDLSDLNNNHLGQEKFSLKTVRDIIEHHRNNVLICENDTFRPLSLRLSKIWQVECERVLSHALAIDTFNQDVFENSNIYMNQNTAREFFDLFMLIIPGKNQRAIMQMAGPTAG